MKLEDLTQDKLDELLETLQANERSVNGLKADLAKAKAKAKGAEIDPEAHAELQTQVETLKAELEKTTKTYAKQTEMLTKQVGEKDTALSRYLIDAQLSDGLAKAGVKPEFLDAVKALHKTSATIKADNGEYVALLGDKPIAEALKEWVGSDMGKSFIAAPNNQGGGANGGNSNGNNTKQVTRQQFDSLSPAQKMEFAKGGGQVVEH